MLGYSFVYSIVRSHHSLVCSLRPACFASSLTPLTRLLTHSRAHGRVNDYMSQNDLVLSHSAVMERYQPSAIVLQCGADSLSGDRLGCFNLTLHGHAKCVEFLKSFDLPLLLLGGGGYTLRNVARCWAYETAVAVDAQNQLSDHLPFHDYFDYYGPDYQLHITTNNMTDQNDRAYLEKI